MKCNSRTEIMCLTSNKQLDPSGLCNLLLKGLTLCLQVVCISVQDVSVGWINVNVLEEVVPHVRVVALWMSTWETCTTRESLDLPDSCTAMNTDLILKTVYCFSSVQVDGSSKMRSYVQNFQGWIKIRPSSIKSCNETLFTEHNCDRKTFLVSILHFLNPFIVCISVVTTQKYGFIDIRYYLVCPLIFFS